MVYDAMRGYLQLALGLTEVSRQRANEAARAVAAQFGITGEDAIAGAGAAAGIASQQVQTLAEDLYEAARSNRKLLTDLVRTEVDVVMTRLASVDPRQVEALRGALARLEETLAALLSSRPGVPGKTSSVASARPLRPEAPGAAAPPPPTKAAKKTTATAKKASPAMKTTAKKTTAKKTTAKKTTAKKTAAKQTTAKQTATAAPARPATVSEATVADAAPIFASSTGTSQTGSSDTGSSDTGSSDTRSSDTGTSHVVTPATASVLDTRQRADATGGEVAAEEVIVIPAVGDEVEAGSPDSP